ncbi:hypothetical protein [Mesorhizobium caraganae]|uniref:hypothetical protein n=1 Tax=Mesorhizobium caraganae TaxID=483206 RepID=UPI001785B436|nr:hypothetical protein [Mesorhizobium caraganae]
MTSAGSATAPLTVLCVNHSGTVPPVSADLRTTATVTTTGSGQPIILSGSSSRTIIEGVTFSAGVGGNAIVSMCGASSMGVKLKNCALRLGASVSNSGNISFGNASSLGCFVELENTAMQFTNTGQNIRIAADFIWKDTPSAITGATIPTGLIRQVSTCGAKIDLRGVDLSALGSGKTIIEATSGPPTANVITLKDCKIDAAVTVAATPIAPGASQVDVLRVAGDATNYRQARYQFAGTLTEETTIVRSGGASNGTTPLSWKIVTTANSTWPFPFTSLPIAIWNDTTGSSVTATIEGIWGGGAVPNNDDIWIEAEYLGSSSSPQASFVNDSKTDSLAANAGHTSSSETWGGSTTKFKMAVSFTPQQKGWVMIRVKAAKASSTFYIDPKVTLS